jgi:hypothetical protein
MENSGKAIVQSPLPVGQTRGLSPFFGRSGSRRRFLETPDGDGGIPAESHPRVRDGGAYTDLEAVSQASNRADAPDFPRLFKVP